MEIPAGRPADVQALLDTLLPACIEAGDAAQAAPPAGTTELSSLVEAFRQLLEVMTRVETDARAGNAPGSADVTEIGEYALQLLSRLAQLAETAGVPGREDDLGALAVNIALWVAGHDGRLDTLEPVVDGLARLANRLRSPEHLETLSREIGRIVAAVSPMISQDLEKLNPGRPWRVLLLNHGIVATRSHNPELMEQAFALLTSRLPEDAGGFFREGMQQMEALNYPPHVRKVMEKYHRQWTLGRTLH